MYIVESTHPYSTHPDLTDERHECLTIEEAGCRFADLTDWDETDAANALVEGDLTDTDEETGREVTARRIPSPEARLQVRRAAARTNLEVAEARVRISRTEPVSRQVMAVCERDNARAVVEEWGVAGVAA